MPRAPGQFGIAVLVSPKAAAAYVRYMEPQRAALPLSILAGGLGVIVGGLLLVLPPVAGMLDMAGAGPIGLALKLLVPIACGGGAALAVARRCRVTQPGLGARCALLLPIASVVPTVLIALGVLGWVLQDAGEAGPLPCCAALLAVLWVPFFIARGDTCVIGGADAPEGLCPRCGYPWAGLPEPICPECGTARPRD
jgi:hypothetical protein